MRILLLFITITCLLYSCTSTSTSDTDKETAGREFIITENYVGKIRKGMSIKDLYDIYPDNQIKRIKTKTDVTTDASDNFYIYDREQNLLLVAAPTNRNDINSSVNRISIIDKRYKTEKDIDLTSNVGQIEKAYPNYHLISSVDEVILFVPDINGNFEINTSNLKNVVLSDSLDITEANIPRNMVVDGLTISWTYTRESLITKSFWHDLYSKFTTWVKEEVPSILILVLIFIGLLRLLRFVIGKIKKVAITRAQRSTSADRFEAQKRINTLSGIIEGGGQIFLWTIFILIMLGKININIAPLLASAGIVGLAIGFGAQELVRDFISGFFILLEDQIRTGDVAIINGTSGTVEEIAMRTITLRDASGVVHIFQNGKIDTLSNMTKGWSAIVVDINLAYSEDTDKATEVLKETGDELYKDSNYAKLMIQPMEIWGIDDFVDRGVIIKIKFTTIAGEQWGVSREFRRRIKKAFEKNNIQIPYAEININTQEITTPIPVNIITQSSFMKEENDKIPK